MGNRSLRSGMQQGGETPGEEEKPGAGRVAFQSPGELQVQGGPEPVKKGETRGILACAVKPDRTGADSVSVPPAS